MATLNEPSPWGTGSGSRPKCQDTTLGDADAQTRFETASKKSHDPPLLEVNTSGSGEDNTVHQDDLTNFVPPTPYDSPLTGGHTPGSDDDCSRLGDQKAAKESQKIRKGVKGKNSRDKALQEYDDDIDDMVNKAMENVEGDTVNAGGAVNTATTGFSAFSASVTTAGMRGEKAKEKRVAFRDVEEPRRSTPAPIAQPSSKYKGKEIMVEPEKPPKNSRKAQIQMDEELAIRLHEEEKVELERMQRDGVAQEEASSAALIAEFDDVQARIDADALLAARL
ncbi:hypothetical protein Tco_1274392 [Tanacetum coccineum]